MSLHNLNIIDFIFLDYCYCKSLCPFILNFIYQLTYYGLLTCSNYAFKLFSQFFNVSYYLYSVLILLILASSLLLIYFHYFSLFANYYYYSNFFLSKNEIFPSVYIVCLLRIVCNQIGLAIILQSLISAKYFYFNYGSTSLITDANYGQTSCTPATFLDLNQYLSYLLSFVQFQSFYKYVII